MRLRGFFIDAGDVSEAVCRRNCWQRAKLYACFCLNRLLRFHGGGLLFFFLHGMLEVFDSFANTFGYFGNFLTPEEKNGNRENHYQFARTQVKRTSSLKAVRDLHYGYLASIVHGQLLPPMLEVSDAFADTFGYLGNFLTPEEKSGNRKNHYQFGRAQVKWASSLKAVRDLHHGFVAENYVALHLLKRGRRTQATDQDKRGTRDQCWTTAVPSESQMVHPFIKWYCYIQ